MSLHRWIAVTAAALLIAWLAFVRWTTPENVPSVEPTHALESSRAPPARPSSEQPVSATAEEAPRTAVVSAPAKVTSPLTLRLVDEANGEPVPRLRAVLVDAWGVREDVESDVNGVVIPAKTDARGDLTLGLAGNGHPADLLQTKRELAQTVPDRVVIPMEGRRANDSRAPLDVKIPVGPTFTLASALPGGRRADEFIAILTCADPRQAFDKLYAGLHADERTWMRFSPKARAMSGGPPWKVQVGSSDGLWSGACEVETISGVRSLAMGFGSTARVRGTVVDVDGKPLANEIVQLWREGASFADVKNRPMVKPTTKDGHFDFLWVPPGACTLKVELAHRTPYAERVDAVAGSVQEVAIALKSSPGADGVIEGIVNSRTGSYDGAITITVVPRVGVRKAETQHPHFEGPATDRVARFRFEGLERVKHELRAFASDGTPIAPRELVLEAAPGAQAVTLVVRDDMPMVELALEVVDDETGEPVVVERLSITPDIAPARGDEIGPLFVAKSLHARVVAAPAYKCDVRADGHRPLWDAPVVPEQGKIRLRVRKGWGSEITVVDLEGRGLDGARVLLDENEAGRTDADGRLRASVGSKPSALRVELAGWKIAVGGEVDPATGTFRSWQPWTRVVMEKVAK